VPRATAIPRLSDLRHAFRSLRRSRTAFGLATASLGVGVAMCVTMFAVIDAIIKPNIPVERADDLYVVQWEARYRRPAPTGSAAATPPPPRPRPSAALERLDAIEALGSMPGSWSFRGGNISSMGIASAPGSALADGQAVELSAATFRMLGARPLHGRFYDGLADPTITGRAVVISEPLWRQLYRDKKQFAPFTLHVGGYPFTVVGVAEPRLERLLYGNVWIQKADTIEEKELVRVRPGVTREQLRVALVGVSAALATAWGIPPANATFRIQSAARRTIGLPTLAIAVSWAALAVLLIACVNIANLQLVRGLSRLRDLAVRVAVGASRADIVRVQLAESTIIALAGGAAGVLLSFVLMHVVRATAPGELIEHDFVAPQFSWRVGAASIVLTGFAATLFGLVPALRVSRFDVNMLLQSGAGTGTTRRSHRYYGALVVVEVAFAMALSVCAALLATTVLAAETYDYGYRSRELIAGGVTVPYRDTTASVLPVVLQRTASIRAMPEIAGASYEIPASFDSGIVTTDAPDPERARRQMPGSDLNLVDRDYFLTLGAPVTGPGFAAYDGTTPIAVIDSIAARTIFGYTDAVGRRMKLGPANSSRPWILVVGVSPHILRTANASSIMALIEPQIFVLDQTGVSVTPGSRLYRALWIARPKATAQATFPILRDRLAPAAVAPLDEMNNRNQVTRIQSFVASVFLGFAIVGMGLAMLGVYSVMAYSVSQRRREFGVRMAFGATGPSLARMVLLNVNIPILAGLALGLVAARTGEGQLGNYVGAFENVAQVVVYLAAPLAMFAAAMAAGLSSALSASRTNPVEAIRGN
jgi:putative ABC transport system permease protein